MPLAKLVEMLANGIVRRRSPPKKYREMKHSPDPENPQKSNIAQESVAAGSPVGVAVGVAVCGMSIRSHLSRRERLDVAVAFDVEHGVASEERGRLDQEACVFSGHDWEM
jgi:hypothetical protein